MTTTTMTNITIFHNPQCGTSRNTLAMIRDTGAEPTVVHYLQTPPSRAELLALIAAMGVPVREVMRQKEPLYTELALDNPALGDDALVDAMLELAPASQARRGGTLLGAADEPARAQLLDD